MVKQFAARTTFPALLLTSQTDVAFRTNLGVNRDDGLTGPARGHLR